LTVSDISVSATIMKTKDLFSLLSRDAVLARYMLWPVTVCPSVCLSVTSRSYQNG